MKKINYVYIAIALSIASCKPDDNETSPIPGLYDITSTITDVQCNAPSNTPEVSELVVEIVEENGRYSMYMCDKQGTRQMLYASSRDGHTFTGGYDTANNNGCYFHFVWEVNVSYNESDNPETISGDGITTISMPAACNAPDGRPCVEKSTFTGTRRIDAVVSTP